MFFASSSIGVPTEGHVTILRHLLAEKRAHPCGPCAGTQLASRPIMNIDRDALSGLFSPQILLPVQFADHDTSKGEKRLMLAVLEEAVATFQGHLEAKTRRGQRLFREAEDWIRSADTVC